MAISAAKPRVLGLTGMIGSGKSAVRAELAALGLPGIDADLVARAIHQDPTHPAVAAIGASFPQALNADGCLRRGSLPDLLASHAEANACIKRILKPWVLEAMERWTRAQSAPVVVWESALIIDEAIAVDRVLVVDADDETRFARLCARHHEWSAAQIRADGDAVPARRLSGRRRRHPQQWRDPGRTARRSEKPACQPCLNLE